MLPPEWGTILPMFMPEGFRRDRTINVWLRSIDIRGNSDLEGTPHSCGGIFYYRQRSHRVEWNGNTLSVDSLWCIQCSGCEETFMDAVVSLVLVNAINTAWRYQPTE